MEGLFSGGGFTILKFFLLLSAFYTLIGLVSGIIVDISYGFIDPRIRMGSRKV